MSNTEQCALFCSKNRVTNGEQCLRKFENMQSSDLDESQPLLPLKYPESY